MGFVLRLIPKKKKILNQKNKNRGKKNNKINHDNIL